MPLNIPSDPITLENRSKTDLARELPTTANPFLEESWMTTQAIANARRVFEFYQQLRILEQEAIPVTAVEKLELWASYWGITLNPATQSTGNVIATGVAGTIIPNTAILQSTSGARYGITDPVTIQDNTASITSITHIGTTAFVTLASNQSLFTGLSVTIAGASPSEYNGTFTIEVTGNNTFTYTMASEPAGNATGTLTAEFVTGILAVKSTTFQTNELDVNQDANAPLTFSTPIVDVTNTAYVDQGGVGGGSLQETLEELRIRLLDRVQNPVAMFNVAAIVAQAKKVTGVTNVFVHEVTPAAGQVTIYFVRGNDDSPIPSGSEVTTVKNKILEIKPANTDDADVIVLAPTAVNQAFVFSSITPDNQATREGITAALEALFIDEGVEGVALTEKQYTAAIVNAGVTDYTLTSPTTDIGGGDGEYPVFAGASFP